MLLELLSIYFYTIRITIIINLKFLLNFKICITALCKYIATAIDILYAYYNHKINHRIN